MRARPAVGNGQTGEIWQSGNCHGLTFHKKKGELGAFPLKVGAAQILCNGDVSKRGESERDSPQHRVSPPQSGGHGLIKDRGIW